jgi:hypothetical protein
MLKPPSGGFFILVMSANSQDVFGWMFKKFIEKGLE